MGLKWLVNRAPKYWQNDGKEQGKGSREGGGGTSILTEREPQSEGGKKLEAGKEISYCKGREKLLDHLLADTARPGESSRQKNGENQEKQPT